MVREVVQALAACAVTFVLCAVLYPLVVWGVGQAAFHHQANGSMITRDGTIIGSELIGQPFVSDTYFHPRPSAAGASGYAADAAGGSNLGSKNPALRDAVRSRAEALGATAANPAPVDLISASGSGLDPHISPEAATFQSSRVANARGVSVEVIHALITNHTERSGTLIGAPPRVNVLRLNLALDERFPAR
jgi:K+-transporting ATPase ATPase C chain